MSTSDEICTDSCKDSDTCDVNDMLQNMSTVDNEVNDISVCANCGKEGDDVTNTCNKCKMVKYCNAACKKKHRYKHKTKCEEHLRRKAEKHDEELFKQPPPSEDCPICFLQLPTLNTGWRYMSCCGKVLCSGCIHAPVYDNQGNKVTKKVCPFCRTPVPSSEQEAVKRLKNRIEAGDPEAISTLGCYYRDGTNGYPQDYTKALEHWHRAGELGYQFSC